MIQKIVKRNPCVVAQEAHVAIVYAVRATHVIEQVEGLLIALCICSALGGKFVKCVVHVSKSRAQCAMRLLLRFLW